MATHIDRIIELQERIKKAQQDQALTPPDKPSSTQRTEKQHSSIEYKIDNQQAPTSAPKWTPEQDAKDENLGKKHEERFKELQQEQRDISKTVQELVINGTFVTEYMCRSSREGSDNCKQNKEGYFAAVQCMGDKTLPGCNDDSDLKE